MAYSLIWTPLRVNCHLGVRILEVLLYLKGNHYEWYMCVSTAMMMQCESWWFDVINAFKHDNILSIGPNTRILMDFKNWGEAKVFKHQDLSAWSLSYLKNGISVASSFDLQDYIYNVACEVWLWVIDMMFPLWFNHHTNIRNKTRNQNLHYKYS